MPTSALAPCVIIAGVRRVDAGEVTIKDLVKGLKCQKRSSDNKSWREGRPAQFSVKRDELVEAVRSVLNRHTERSLIDARRNRTRFEALEALATKLRALFTKAGFEPVAPAILQPADILLDCSGEALRARTYVFTDLDGHELCLRPDLTVPTARLYLERHPTVHDEARYCYNGPTFRYSPPANGKNTRPREFRQMGLELYGMSDRLAAEAEIFKLTIEGMSNRPDSDNYKIKDRRSGAVYRLY